MLQLSKLERAVHLLRTWSTVARPAKHLLYVLLGSWVCLWFSLGRPPVLQFLLGTSMVVVFVFFRYGSTIHYEVAAKKGNQRTDKRDFLFLIGGLAVLIGATTIPADPGIGIIVAVVLVVIGVTYAAVAP